MSTENLGREEQRRGPGRRENMCKGPGDGKERALFKKLSKGSIIQLTLWANITKSSDSMQIMSPVDSSLVEMMMMMHFLCIY